MTSQDFIIILQKNNEALIYEFKQDLTENSEILRKEFKAGQDELRKEFKAGQNELRAEIKINAVEIRNLRDSMNWNFSTLGIIIAIAGFVLTLAPLLKEMYKDSREDKKKTLTPEQVQKMIDDAIKASK